MKRILSAILILTLLLTLAAIPAAQADGYATAVVKGGWLRLRDGASSDAETISAYYTGTKVTILGGSGEWYHVLAPDGKTGYMHSGYLTVTGSITGGQLDENTVAMVKSDNGKPVRLRSGPSTQYPIVASYAVGTPLTILSTGDTWSKIRINGRTGYMMNEFIKTYGYGGDNDPKARVAFNKAGIYAQDEWNATKNFKLTYGLRLDGLFFDNGDLMTNKAIYDLNYGGRHIDTGKWPNAQVSVSPRVGFNWDILGNKTLKLRGGTGLFSGRLPLVFFTNMPTNSGMIQYQAQINSKNASERGFTMGEFAGGLVTDANGHATIAALKDKLISLGYPANITPEQGTVPSSISAVDNKFKMPQVWKTSLAIDYQLPVSFPFTITAEGIFNKAVNDVTISDWSMTDTRGYARWNGADNRPIYPEVFRIPGNKQAFVLENTHKGYGWSANVSVNMRPWDFLSFMASYTHSVKKELTSMPGSNAESAFTYVPTISGPNNINLHNAYNITPDRFIASLTGHDKSNNHYSLIYETWRGGYNYSYMLQNDMNGDGYAYDALYIPTDKQVQNGEFRFASEDDKTRFMDYVHGDSYLKNHQGEYAEAYSVYSPWVHRVDVSYKHDFKIKAGKSMNTLQLGFDIKNLMNLFNSSWGVSKYMNSKLNEGRILKYEHTDADGYAVFSTPTAVSKDIKTFVPNHAVGQCWYMSIGVKYMFN